MNRKLAPFAPYVCALVSGVCIALSAVPNAWHLFGFAGPALLFFAIESPIVARRPGRGFLLGLISGATANALILWWTVDVLENFGHFPKVASIPTALLLFFAQGLSFAFASWVTTAMAHKGLPAWVLLPVTLTVFSSYSPELFPWRLAGTQVTWTSWIQLADVGGEPLLDVLVALVGCGFLRALQSRDRIAGMVALMALGVPWLYGTVRLARIERQWQEAEKIPVGVIQPNVGIEEKHNPHFAFDHLHTLRHLTHVVETEGAALAVWPESAYPFPIPRDQRHDYAEPYSALGSGNRIPLLMGTETRGGPCERWNSVVSMTRSGSITGVADKLRLLAFGEYVPLWAYLPPLQERFLCPGILPGKEPVVLTIAGARVGILNCYEDVIADAAKALAKLNPNFLVNVTNDAWFGDTGEPYLHQAMAVFRAVETRKDLIRSVNTGVSSHILATGTTMFATPTWVQTSFVSHVALLAEQTFWVLWGDLFTPALTGCLLGIALAMARIRRIRPEF